MSDKTQPDSPPLPPGANESGFADRRKFFEDLSSSAEQNSEAERAFLENKVEMIRDDRKLTADERERALAQLQARIDLLAKGDHK